MLRRLTNLLWRLRRRIQRKFAPDRAVVDLSTASIDETWRQICEVSNQFKAENLERLAAEIDASRRP